MSLAAFGADAGAVFLGQFPAHRVGQVAPEKGPGAAYVRLGRVHGAGCLGIEEDAVAVFAAAQDQFFALGFGVAGAELLHGQAQEIGQALALRDGDDDASLPLAAVAAHAAVKYGFGHVHLVLGPDLNHKAGGLARGLEAGLKDGLRGQTLDLPPGQALALRIPPSSKDCL